MIDRRSFLRASLGAAGAAALSACGIRGRRATRASDRLGRPTGRLSIASWPLYIDVDPKTKKRPSIERFERTTGIRVSYDEVIDDNEPFFGKIRAPLAHGDRIGWDVVVLTDWLIGRMARLGYLERLHPERLPLVRANEGSLFRGRDARYGVPWQAGITGIGYNPRLTGRPIGSFGDLFDPAFRGKVGMLSDMRDMLHLTLLWMGVDPRRADTSDLEAARDKLLVQRREGIVRNYYSDNYTEALAVGDLALCIAYSGDVFQLQADNPELRFVVPKEGGMLWIDEMAIPVGAEHPADAHEWMNYVYRPEVAAAITLAVRYITPVPASRDVLRSMQERTSGAGRREIGSLVSSPLIYPSGTMTARLHRYRVLTEDQERTWNDLFAPVVEG